VAQLLAIEAPTSARGRSRLRSRPLRQNASLPRSNQVRIPEKSLWPKFATKRSLRPGHTGAASTSSRGLVGLTIEQVSRRFPIGRGPADPPPRERAVVANSIDPSRAPPQAAGNRTGGTPRSRAERLRRDRECPPARRGGRRHVDERRKGDRLAFERGQRELNLGPPHESRKDGRRRSPAGCGTAAAAGPGFFAPGSRRGGCPSSTRNATRDAAENRNERPDTEARNFKPMTPLGDSKSRVGSPLQQPVAPHDRRPRETSKCIRHDAAHGFGVPTAGFSTSRSYAGCTGIFPLRGPPRRKYQS
jgi:hypothetical protein